jgi:hypothetical protein
MSNETQDKNVVPDDVIDIEEFGNAGKEPPKHRRYRIRVDKQHAIFDNEVVTGREILVAVGKEPSRFRLDQKLRGGETKKIELTDEVDLTTPGIERFMTLPLDSQEGEVAEAKVLRREFDLPEEDVEHLNARRQPWETLVEGNAGWLLIRDFPVPEGYRMSAVTLALMIPSTYPTTQIDMFYVSPFLELASGRIIRQTQGRNSVCGLTFQRWSRHRTSQNPWRPGIDNIATHLGVVDECLAREVARG